MIYARYYDLMPMANMMELQTPLSQPWENPHRWRPRVALEVPIKHAPLYALPNYISFSRGGSQDSLLDCDSRVPPLILSETEENQVRYSYRVMWNVSLFPFSTSSSDHMLYAGIFYSMGMLCFFLTVVVPCQVICQPLAGNSMG